VEDSKVKIREFIVSDLVLLLSPRMESSGKLESKWDEPYAIMEKTRPWAYRLTDPKARS
jgi:hypothetical protein